MKENIPMTIRLPGDMKENLQQEAQERGYTLSDMIRFILFDRFEKPTVQE